MSKGGAVGGSLFVAAERNEQELPWDNLVLGASWTRCSGRLPYPPTLPSAAGCRQLCWQLTGELRSGSRTSGSAQNLVLGCNETNQNKFNSDKFPSISLTSRFASENFA